MLLFFHVILTCPVFLIHEADEECHKPSVSCRIHSASLRKTALPSHVATDHDLLRSRIDVTESITTPL
jgi:hypothetical protein